MRHRSAAGGRATGRRYGRRSPIRRVTARRDTVARMTDTLDPRLTPARAGGRRSPSARIASRRPASWPATPRRVTAPAAPLRRAPSPEAGLDTEALLGDAGRPVRRGRRLRLRAARPRRLCRLPAGRLPRPGRAGADPPGHGAAHLPVSRAGPEAAGPRPSEPRRPPRGDRRGGRVSGDPGGLRVRRALRARGDPRAGLRGHGRAAGRDALSVGRPHEPRARLLRPRAALPGRGGAALPARRRHAGGGSRAGLAPRPRGPAPGRPRVLARPCRPDARFRDADPRQRPPHGGGGGAAGGGRRPDPGHTASVRSPASGAFKAAGSKSRGNRATGRLRVPLPARFVGHSC